MERLFGTDGVRGIANKDLTPHLALDLSIAAARVLGEAGESTGRRPMAVVAGVGRVLLRKSGTEQVVRVMVEAPTPDQAACVADRLAAIVKSELS